MNPAAILIGAIFGGLVVFIALSLKFFSMIDDGILRWRRD